jgi:hypothetical protein
MARYLLPCNCGRRLTVTAAQAGDLLLCECGQRVEVPTLRHLAGLEQVDDAPPRERTWGARQGLIFLGATLIVLAVAALIWLQFREPQPIREPLFEHDASKIDKMSYGDLWKIWSNYEKGIQRTLFGPEAAAFEWNRFEIQQWRQWRWTAVAVAGAGVVVIVIGLLAVPHRKRRQQTK